MSRPIPPERLGQLIDAATSTFIALGYRRTQMADVAETLGVAKGTLYGYVESKAALFDAAIRFADGRSPMPDVTQLPLSTPKPRATVRYIRERLAAEVGDIELARVVASGKRTADAAEELGAILLDLYRRMSANRRVLKLIDRCAIDFPELASVWFGEGRWAHHELLERYFERRIAEGHFRRPTSVAIAARTTLETVAFWAMHRHYDASPRDVPEHDVERTLVELLARGWVRT